MFKNKYWFTITFCGISIFLIIISSICAANSNPIRPEAVLIYNPEEVQYHLLMNFIVEYNPSLTEEERSNVYHAVHSEAVATGLDPFLISSVIAAESSFYPGAVSPCQARGLMQLTTCVTDLMNIGNPFDISENIYAGTRYLKYLQQQFKDSSLILAAYNAGPTLVAHLGRIPRIEETENYVQKVTFLHHLLQQKMCLELQSLMFKPIFCPVMQTITHDNSITKLNFITKWQPPLSMETNDFCETDRQSLFVFKA